MDIKHYKNLHAWEKGHELVLSIYRVTATFPPTEAYGLTNQLRRAAVSVTSNIAEGFSRKSNKEKVQFYHLSKGSLSEIDNQITIAKDLHYIDLKVYTELQRKIDDAGKILFGLIRSIKE